MNSQPERGVARRRRGAARSASRRPAARCRTRKPEPVGSSVVTTIQSCSTVVAGRRVGVADGAERLDLRRGPRRSACRAARPCRPRTALRRARARVVENTVASRFGRLISAFDLRTTWPSLLDRDVERFPRVASCRFNGAVDFAAVCFGAARPVSRRRGRRACWLHRRRRLAFAPALAAASAPSALPPPSSATRRRPDLMPFAMPSMR